VDGEGCFSVAISKHPTARSRWKIDPHFQVYQHKDNSKVLYLLQDVLQCGYVSKKGGNPSCFMFCVDNINQLIYKIIPFFEQHPLIGEKYDNFLIFKDIVYDLFKKKHFEKQGFIDIAQKAYLMNRAGKYRKNSFETVVASLK